jgi:pimeloyl-ACP methyl ester carboxylesterase
MSQATERFVSVNDSKCRVLEKGEGKPLVVISGYGGLPRWDAFHEALSTKRRVIAPALPGQFGSERGHEKLHNPLDWLAMVQDLIAACGVDAPADIVACSVAGMLATELAAASSAALGKLVLVGSYGLYDDAEPTVNLFAQSPAIRTKLMVADQDKYRAVFAPSPNAPAEEQEEWAMLAYRCDEAVARLVWPFGDIGLKRRIHRIVTPTLLVWGADDKLVPPSYAKRFADGISGPTRVEIVKDAGHIATVDQPEAVARLVLDFVG